MANKKKKKKATEIAHKIQNRCLPVGFRPLHQNTFCFGSVRMLHVSHKSGGIKCEVWGSLDNVRYNSFLFPGEIRHSQAIQRKLKGFATYHCNSHLG